MFVALAPGLKAGDVVKANNADALNLTSSWSLGALPGSGDVAVWDSTVDANRSTALGADTAWQGIRIANPGGTATLMTISGANILTLGSAGIDMSAATTNLTVSAPINIGSTQQWTVASGRTLTVGAASTTTGGSVLTLNGPGTFSLGNNASLGTGQVIISGAPTLTGGTGRVLTPGLLTLNSDMTLRPAAASSNMQLSTSIDVGSATRTVYIDRADTTATYALLISGPGSGTTSYTGTGTLALASSNPGGNVVNVRVGGSASLYTLINTGLHLGDGIRMFLAGTGSFTTSTRMSLESGATLEVGVGSTSYNPTFQSLSGAGGTIINATTGTGTSTITLDGTANTTTTTYAGALNDGGTGKIAITKAGTTTQILSGTNTYTGKTTINGGILQYGKLASLYNGNTANWTAANITAASGATFAVNVGGAGEFASTDVDTLLANLSVATASTGLRAGSNVGFDTTNASGGSFTQGNAIADSTGVSGGAIGVAKFGANTLELDKTNTYTGATQINGGTLLVSGSGSINSSSGVSVNTGAHFKYNSSTAYTAPITVNGGKVSGTGTLNVDLALNNIADTLSPGNSPGTLPLGVSQNWSAFTYDWEVNDFTGLTAGTDYDLITIAGSLTLNNSNLYEFNLLSLLPSDLAGDVDNFSEIARSWTVLSTTGGITGFNASNWTVDASGFTNAETGVFTLTQSGNDLVLSYSAIPEPSTYALMLGGLGLVAYLRRRSKS